MTQRAAHRLRAASDFERLRRLGRTWSNALLALQAVPGEHETSRCGFVVSRRVGSAVTRNRVRRRLREIVYPKLAELIGKWDLVLVARSAAAVATYGELRGAVDDLLRKARVAAP